MMVQVKPAPGHAESKNRQPVLRRVDKPFYGLKSYKAETVRPVHAVRKRNTAPFRMPKISPWKIISVTMLTGLAGFLYLTHVFTTQEILNEVNDLRREYEAANRIRAEHSLAYDRMTGPAEIYEKAGELGFIHGGAGDPVIRSNQ